MIVTLWGAIFLCFEIDVFFGFSVAARIEVVIFF